MYDKTITLFNKYEGQTGTFWYPSVLRNVDLTTDKAAITAKYGEQSQDSASLHVKYQREGLQKLVGGKPWLPPKEWENQVNDLLPETLTFQSGDFFWWGEWTDTEIINDSDYGIEGFQDYMARKHDFVFRISTVGGPWGLIPHFEIMGR